MKRIICLLSVLVLLISVSAHASGLNDVRIVTVPEELPARYVVPSRSADGRTIRTIGAGAYADHEELRVVVIPDCITSIEDEAFRGCRIMSVMLIPETVQSIGEDVFKDVTGARSAGYAPFCIVTPRGSVAAAYARQNGIACIEMIGTTLAEHSDAYISLLLFSRDYINNSFGWYDPEMDTLWGDMLIHDYLSAELGGGNGLASFFDRDTLMLALNNLDMALYQVLDWLFIPGDGNTYMADIYASELNQVLSLMTGISELQLNTAALTDPAKGFLSDEPWKSLEDWLVKAGYGNSPVTKSFAEFKDEINQFVDTVEEYTYVANFVLHCLTDYSQSLAVLEILQDMADESSDDTFVYAVNQLDKQYDTELGGMIYKAIDEMLMPALTGIANAATIEWAATIKFAGESTLGGVLGIYTFARTAIDIGLKASGSADFRGKQLSYIAMLEICNQAERLYRICFENCDGSPVALQKLQILWELNCCARIRICSVLEQLYADEEDRKAVTTRQDAYLAQMSYAYSYYSSAMMDHSEPFGTEMRVDFLTEPDTHQTGAGLYARWETATAGIPGNYHESWYEEYGYESVGAEIYRYVDDVPLGQLASWYFWEDDGEVDAYAVFDQLMLQQYYWGGADDPLWQLYAFGWISSVKLEQSELYRYEKRLEEDYVSECIDEYYLFRVTMVTEEGYLVPFEVLFLEHASSGGEEYGQYILIPSDALALSAHNDEQFEEVSFPLTHEEAACIQQYEGYLNTSGTTYTEAVVADFDFDGMPEVIARYSVDRWGSDCHILDVENGCVTVHQVHATFSNNSAVTLYQLPSGEMCWMTFHSEAAQGERYKGIARIGYDASNGYDIRLWYHYGYRTPDLSNPGITYYIGPDYRVITEDAYFQQVAVFEASVPLISISMKEMSYPDYWTEAV